MYALLIVSALLVTGTNARLMPRALQTLEIPLPTQAKPFTSTVPGCGTVAPFVVVGVTTGTFQPGDFTIYLPPQASATGTTIVDPGTNATEILTCIPLQGDCADFPFPPAPTETASSGLTGVPSPTPTPDACPSNGCSAKVIKTAQTIIDLLNKVTLLSQTLQIPAKLVGASASKRDDAAIQSPIDDIAKGLRGISVEITVALPRIAYLPPIPPGCDSDTVVIALIQFVKVHQALLNILIGRAGLLQNSPILKERDETGALQVIKRDPAKDEESALIGAAVAGALRVVESAVDTIAFKLISLIPTRSECAKQQKEAVDGSLKDAIAAYDAA
ncbi:hypothetical protein BDV96DRAFT_647551 [Lophiotrema nucula]|uniref:Hydrophobic surface binding protein A-domain-containing protein n=1 Tax=Lophiotrema nucula TaxID=690887 RepID=A0A6A5Z3U5_9PLEO|nr:hypothetical protein BDV96DRAFT_647551 [Lophiotrema nucula]